MADATAETVEVVDTEAPVTVVATTEEAPAPKRVGNPILDQEKKRGIPNNTWTLWYGGLKFDCVEGVERTFPEEVFTYLKRSGNLLNPDW
jgi:hypothetical protein